MWIQSPRIPIQIQEILDKPYWALYIIFLLECLHHTKFFYIIFGLFFQTQLEIRTLIMLICENRKASPHEKKIMLKYASNKGPWKFNIKPNISVADPFSWFPLTILLFGYETWITIVCVFTILTMLC